MCTGRRLRSRGGGLVALTRIFTASLAVSLAALAWAPAALAATGDSATGSGTYRWRGAPDGSDVFANFSFSATGGTGEFGQGATGTMTFTGDGDTITAAVQCLTVVGNNAGLSGMITASTITDPTYAGSVGHALTFEVIDNGTPDAGVDRFLARFGGTNTSSCNPLFDEITVPLTAGEIIVVDTDADNDGLSDTSDNCPGVANPNQANSDADALGDACDPDDDNDGVPDGSDAFPRDPSESADTDGDSVGNNADNCPTVANASQSDVDSDGIGDACDPVDNRDADADGILDTNDNCPLVANSDQRDTDRDGLGDACDPSDDRTAEQQIADLITQLQTTPAGPGNSYLAKLQGIADSIGDGNANAACNKLGAFESEVRAQTGKKLTPSEADVLLRETAAIKTKAGCP